jgi:site-specific DNA-adenine methylase
MYSLHGKKKKKYIQTFLINFFPKLIDTYVEPFGGTFSVGVTISPFLNIERKIYNDINIYPLNNIDDSVEIYNIDYTHIIEKFDSSTTLFYIDPPYYGKEIFYFNFKKKYDKDFHIDLFDKIKTIKGKFILSYESNKFIESLYKDFRVVKYDGELFSCRNEILILNF